MMQWQSLPSGGEYLDTGGHGRLTIRPRGGGYLLRVHGFPAGTFPTIDAARAEGLARAQVIVAIGRQA